MRLLIIITLFSSCEKDKIEAEGERINQEVLFQYEFLNFAWGYQHTGWLIDSSGNVYCYDSPEVWNHGDSSGIITQTEMIENLQETNAVCLQVNEYELVSKFKLIEKASEGELTEPVNEMYDAGISAYYGFVYDPGRRVYQRILLKQIGDFEIDNTSSEAIDLYHWMDQIDQEVKD